MNNLEKLTAGEVAARNNGTLEQLREVVGHCFPNNTRQINGGAKYYFKHANSITSEWDCNSYSPYKAIDITQLWEELQAMKKPEIWWIKVTGENKETLIKWYGVTLFIGNMVGMVKRNGKVTSGHNQTVITKHESDVEIANYDFGNEIDFTTFLKYTGVEVDPEKVEKSLEEKISELTQLINKRVELNIKSDRLNDELTEINTKLSALLK